MVSKFMSPGSLGSSLSKSLPRPMTASARHASGLDTPSPSPHVMSHKDIMPVSLNSSPSCQFVILYAWSDNSIWMKVPHMTVDLITNFNLHANDWCDSSLACLFCQHLMAEICGLKILSFEISVSSYVLWQLHSQPSCPHKRYKLPISEQTTMHWRGLCWRTYTDPNVMLCYPLRRLWKHDILRLRHSSS